MKGFIAFILCTVMTIGLAAVFDPNMSLSAMWGRPTALEVANPNGGMLVRKKPVQTQITKDTNDTVIVGDYTLTPQAQFSLDALVLSKKNYSQGREADISPTDLALGWGMMSDPAYIKQLRITQRRRFYFWSYGSDANVNQRDVINNSSNMHIIPASQDIANELQEVRDGDVVRLRGRLVNARTAGGWRWKSSLVRTDTGAGACELFLVEYIAIKK